MCQVQDKAGRYVGLPACNAPNAKRWKCKMLLLRKVAVCVYMNRISVTIHGRMRGVPSVATGVWFNVMVIFVIHYELHVLVWKLRSAMRNAHARCQCQCQQLQRPCPMDPFPCCSILHCTMAITLNATKRGPLLTWSCKLQVQVQSIANHSINTQPHCLILIQTTSTTSTWKWIFPKCATAAEIRLKWLQA